MLTDLKISLIITTYNRPDALQMVLESVISQSILPDEVIIAGDGSNNETAELIKIYINKTDFPIIHCWQEDLGFRLSHIRNKAITKANYPYIISIDGDIILHKNFIADHKKYAREGYFIQGSRVLLNAQLTQTIIYKNKFNVNFFSTHIRNRFHSLRIHFLSELFYITLKNKYNCIKGCNMAFWKNDLIKVNGYNENFCSWGSEDKELVARLYNSKIYGKRVKFAAIAYHLSHGREIDKFNLEKNNLLLEKAKINKIKFCDKGIFKTKESLTKMDLSK